MNSIFYGIKRLILLNTNKYLLGDFPLDKPLSISASNGTGKSTAINALQFLLLNNINDMSFPRSNDDTRKWYFSFDNSYVLIEVMTELGVFVLGAVGKGATSSFEYQLFAYKSELDLNDFTNQIDDNTQNVRQLKELSQHLALKNIMVKQLSPKQMRDALLGKQVELAHGETFTIGLFRLKSMTDTNYKLFIKVFKNLLHMNDINFEEIKRLLIEILLPTYENSTIDFMARYRLLMEEVESARNRAEAAIKIESDVRELINTKINYDENCGILHALFPKITQSFEKEKQKREEKINQIILEIEQIKPEIARKTEEQKPLLEENQKNAVNKNTIEKRLEKIETGNRKYFMPSTVAELENELEALNRQITKLIGELQSAKRISIENIDNQIKRNEKQINQLQVRLKSIDSNLLFLLKTKYNESQLKIIAKLFNTELLSSVEIDDKNSFIVNEKKLFEKIDALLLCCENEVFKNDAICLNLKEVKAIDLKEYFNADAIKNELQQLIEQQEYLNQDLDTAKKYKIKEQQVQDLEKSYKDKEQYLKDYQTYLLEKKQESAIKIELSIIEQKITENEDKFNRINSDLVELGGKETRLDSERKAKLLGLKSLDEKYKQIKPLTLADGLGVIPTHILPTELEDMMNTYILASENRKKDLAKIENLMAIIENKGGRRFTADEALSITVTKLSEAIEAIPNLKKDVENQRKTACQEVGALLKDLIDRYNSFKVELHKFNNQMKPYKISNLKSVHFIIDDNNEILKLVEKLVEQDSLFSDLDKIHQAIKRLDELVTERGIKLSLESLFNMGYQVETENGEIKTSFVNIKTESTGTAQSIKIIFNVILLNKLLYIKKGQMVHIPIYIDEAGQIDLKNQEVIVELCIKLGFIPVLAAVGCQSSAYYWVGLQEMNGRIFVNKDNWVKLTKITEQ